MNLNINEIFIPPTNRNRPGRVNPMNFVTIHETGNTRAGANARAHASFLNNPNTLVSYHYTVDDTEIVQHLPENEDGFHAGDGTGPGNRQSIGIEIAVNSDGDFLKAVELAAKLTANICQRRKIPLENIRQHFHWSRKNCPQNIRAGSPFPWEAFIALVRNMQEQPPQGVNLQIGGATVRVPARHVNGRWLLDLPDGPEGQPQPGVLLRVALETMGFSVSWDGDSKTVIATPKQ